MNDTPGLPPKRITSVGIGAMVTFEDGSFVLSENATAEDAAIELCQAFDRVR